jgi:hypothetical protein
VDLLIEMLPNRSQPSVVTLNENGTPSTVSKFLPMRADPMGPTPAGVGEGLGRGVAEGEGEGETVGPLPVIPPLAGSRLMLTTVTTTTAAAAIASVAEVFVSVNCCAGHQERRCTAERTDRMDDPTVSVGDGDGSDWGDGLPEGAMLAVPAASRLCSSGCPTAGFPAPSDGEAPTT